MRFFFVPQTLALLITLIATATTFGQSPAQSVMEVPAVTLSDQAVSQIADMIAILGHDASRLAS